MKSLFPKGFLIFLALLMPTLLSFKPKGATTYKVDINRSAVSWIGYYVFSFSEHNGTIGLSGGEITVDDKQIISGYFDIDMKTIKDLDMTADDGAKDLESHLMSDDFFSVNEFPLARFEITKAEKIKDAVTGGPNYDVTGDLTLKGVKNSLTFPALIDFNDTGLEAKAKFKFDRTRWNVRYNSGKFFFDIGDGAISDAIGLEIHLFTTKK
ncbi:MAG TPA: YceI family protein [Chryseolinea sp.]|nr:YceI family protein [Chryseolinea sp.]